MKNSIIEKINKSVVRLLEPISTDEMYNILVDEAVNLVNADEGLIIMQENGILRNVYASTPGARAVRPRKNGYAYKAFTEQKAFVIHTSDFELHDPSTAKQGIRSILFIPLSYKGKAIGVLAVRTYRDKERFTQDQLETLQLFGSLASLAIIKTNLYDETKKALDSRDLFISMAAHELRTPLTSVNGYIQLLHKTLSSKHPDTQEAKWSEQLSWEIKRLIILMNELLEVNRIKAGKLQFYYKEHSLREVLNRSISNFSFLYPHRKIIYKDNLKENNDIVIGDFDKLLQIFTNVLDNAAKFSPIDTPIAMTLDAKNDHICVQIKDTGKGIPENEIAKVFDGFYRGKNQSEEGIGIGLFLVKNILQMHKGSIKITSKLKKGTTVEISLPVVHYEKN